MHRKMWARTRAQAVADRTHLQIVGLERAKGALDPREGLVAAHAVGCREVLSRQRCADDVDAVEGGLAVDPGLLAPVLEAVVADVAGEVLGDLVVVAHLADPQADLGGALEVARGDAGADRLEQGLGGLQQRLAGVGALDRQARVATGHQALAGKVRVLQDLEQAHLVGAVQLAGALQLADRAAAQRADPVDAVELAQLGDLGLHQHAAVADQDHAREAEAAAQLVDGRHEVPLAGLVRVHPVLRCYLLHSPVPAQRLLGDS